MRSRAAQALPSYAGFPSFQGIDFEDGCAAAEIAAPEPHEGELRELHRILLMPAGFVLEP